MWPTLCARYGPWFILFFGIQNRLVRSDVANYDDAEVNEDNDFMDFRRVYDGGYGNPTLNQPLCPTVGLCELMAGPLKAVRTALAELEANSAAYCETQPGSARFQPMNFPSFPSMDFMQFPPFASFMSPPNALLLNPPPNNAPVANPPLPNYSPVNYAPPVDQQQPNPSQQEPNKSPPAGNPWDILAGTGPQSHKKIKVKVCNSRRSGIGKKKHAAAAVPIQKPPREEKEYTTSEAVVVGLRGDDEFRGATSTAPDVPSVTISHVGNDTDGKEDKTDRVRR